MTIEFITLSVALVALLAAKIGLLVADYAPVLTPRKAVRSQRPQELASLCLSQRAG